MPEVTYHDGQPAVNVKDRHNYANDPKFAPFYESLGEVVVEWIYDGVQSDFWDHYAPEIAREFGYGDVYSAGRSSGWLVVEKAPELEDEDDPGCEVCEHVLLTELPGGEQRCDDCGHIQESPLQKARARWAEFEQRIEQEMNYCRDQLLERLVEAVEEKNAEPELPPWPRISRSDAAAVVAHLFAWTANDEDVKVNGMDEKNTARFAMFFDADPVTTMPDADLLKLGETTVREICARYDNLEDADYHKASRMSNLSMALGDAFDALAGEVQGESDDDAPTTQAKED